MFKLMQISDYFIGNDSGLMHIMTLANIKTIGLFGPSNNSSMGLGVKETWLFLA